MLQRYLLNFVLIFLFAFAQIGVAAHEISHITNAEQHSQQQDGKSKNTVAEQCAQCLSYAKVASGLGSEAIALPSDSAEVVADTVYFSSFSSTLLCAYGARAPPQ
ncbi:MAG: hypothetical protein VW548_00890, partial [Methylotenera sp.]